MYKLFSVFVVLSLATSCVESRRKCAIDESLKREIFNCIEVVKLTVDGESVEFLDRAFAFETLDLLTAKRGEYLPLSDIGYAYESEDLFERDLERWEEWYESNKCNLTKAYVDSLFVEFNKTDTINWPKMIL